jgi:hypothetical protein
MTGNIVEFPRNVVRFPRRNTAVEREVDRACEIFAALVRRDEPAAVVLSRMSNVARRDIFNSFSRAHHLLNVLQREVETVLDQGGRGGAA